MRTFPAIIRVKIIKWYTFVIKSDSMTCTLLWIFVMCVVGVYWYSCVLTSLHIHTLFDNVLFASASLMIWIYSDLKFYLIPENMWMQCPFYGYRSTTICTWRMLMYKQFDIDSDYWIEHQHMWGKSKQQPPSTPHVPSGIYLLMLNVYLLRMFFKLQPSRFYQLHTQTEIFHPEKSKC